MDDFAMAAPMPTAYGLRFGLFAATSGLTHLSQQIRPLNARYLRYAALHFPYVPTPAHGAPTPAAYGAPYFCSKSILKASCMRH